METYTTGCPKKNETAFLLNILATKYPIFKKKSPENRDPFFFGKYLSPQKSLKNVWVFNTSVWISVFRRKKRFENPIFGCRDTKQKWNLDFFWGTQFIIFNRCWQISFIIRQIICKNSRTKIIGIWFWTFCNKIGYLDI